MSNPYVGKGWTTRLFAATQPKYAFRADEGKSLTPGKGPSGQNWWRFWVCPGLKSQCSQIAPKVGEVEMAGYGKKVGFGDGTGLSCPFIC